MWSTMHFYFKDYTAVTCTEAKMFHGLFFFYTLKMFLFCVLLHVVPLLAVLFYFKIWIVE